MARKFVLRTGSTGRFRFSLLAGKGQVILVESYESKEAALNGIESVKANAPGGSTDHQT